MSVLNEVEILSASCVATADESGEIIWNEF